MATIYQFFYGTFHTNIFIDSKPNLQFLGAVEKGSEVVQRRLVHSYVHEYITLWYMHLPGYVQCMHIPRYVQSILVHARYVQYVHVPRYVQSVLVCSVCAST